MKEWLKAIQIGAIFIGSIVGAGLSSGRELNQFFGIYGYKSLVGLLVCGLAYVVVGGMIVDISYKYRPKSYDAFIELVCPRWIARFTNIILTLFLVSSTSIILAGSSALVHEYFGVPKWMGFVGMIGWSVLFLLRQTKGLFEVNNVVVPCLIFIMFVIFIGFYRKSPAFFTFTYLEGLETKRQHYWWSSVVYAGFNIISIVGILVPLTYELRRPQVIKKGIVLGTVFLTLISGLITLLMIVHPTYPDQYDLPILAVAKQIGGLVPMGLMLVIWLELFSSIIANIYSLSKGLENRIKMPYEKSVGLILLIAMPLAFVGFANLVEIIYPLYGVLSLAFVISSICFYIRERIHLINFKKNKQRISHVHKM